MKLVWAYFKAETLQLLRLPAYIIPLLLFPSLFFLVLGMPYATDPVTANFLMASYSIFAVQGIMLFQFGAGIAEERELAWYRFLRSLPVSPQIRLGVQILLALAFAIVASIIVIGLALLATPVALTPLGWMRLILALLLGSVPFALLGIALGYWTFPRVVLPVAALLYFGLSFGGGLWIPPGSLPGFAAAISPYLPTRQWGEIAWAAALGQPWLVQPWLWLLGYTLIFGVSAAWGYWRNKRR
jgi:ABC-2 type transport system permease protein